MALEALLTYASPMVFTDNGFVKAPPCTHDEDLFMYGMAIEKTLTRVDKKK